MCMCGYVGLCMWVYVYTYVRVGKRVHMKVWVAQNVQLTELYSFQCDVVPGKFLEM